MTRDLPRRGTPLQFLHSFCGWRPWPRDSLIPPAFTLVVSKHSFHVQHCLFCRNAKSTFRLLICCLNLLYDTLAKQSGNLKPPMLAHSILDSFNWEMSYWKKKKSACDFFLFFAIISIKSVYLFLFWEFNELYRPYPWKKKRLQPYTKRLTSSPLKAYNGLWTSRLETLFNNSISNAVSERALLPSVLWTMSKKGLVFFSCHWITSA